MFILLLRVTSVYVYRDFVSLQISAEFKRITTMPLQSRFLSQLDLLSDKLLKLFKNRGGQIGKRLQSILACMTEVREFENFEIVLIGVHIEFEQGLLSNIFSFLDIG